MTCGMGKKQMPVRELLFPETTSVCSFMSIIV